MKANLKAIKTDNTTSLDKLSIEEIIGRDAKPFLKLNKPKFDEDKKHLIKFETKGIKWFNNLFRFDSKKFLGH